MKRIKTHIVKILAVAISIIYMLMPMHKEIISVLHSISHTIEKPGFIMSHHHDGDLKNTFKNAKVLQHEHIIIDLLDGILDVNASPNDSKNPSMVDIEIDKHFHSPINLKLKLVSVTITLACDTYIENVKAPFYRKIKVPPRTT